MFNHRLVQVKEGCWGGHMMELAFPPRVKSGDILVVVGEPGYGMLCVQDSKGNKGSFPKEFTRPYVPPREFVPKTVEQSIMEGRIGEVQQWLGTNEHQDMKRWVNLCDSILGGADPTIAMDFERFHHVQQIRDLLRGYRVPARPSLEELLDCVTGGLCESYQLAVPDDYWKNLDAPFLVTHLEHCRQLVDAKFSSGIQTATLQDVQVIVGAYFAKLLEASVILRASDAEETRKLQHQLIQQIDESFPAVSHFATAPVRVVPPTEFWEDDLGSFAEPFFCPKGWTLLRKDMQHFSAAPWAKDALAGYHGTNPDVIKLIMGSGFLAAKNACGADRPTCYLSPSLMYAAHPRYAKPIKVGTTAFAQAILLVAVEPASIYKRIPETLCAQDVEIDQHFPGNANLELLVGIPFGATHLAPPNVHFIGVLIRVSDKLESLPEAVNWWGCPGAKFATPPFE